MRTPLPTDDYSSPEDTLQEFREHSDFYSNFVAPGGPQTLFWQKIYDARQQFHEGKSGQFTHIRPHIIRSWKRSSAAGAPYTGLPSVRLSAEELNNVLKRNEFLLSTAKPVMQELLENIHPTSNCIILTDSNGVYLYTRGDDLGAGRRPSTPLRGLVSGEPIEGTTSMGICLVEQQATCVLGCEHYNPYFDSWSCAAAPIFDHENKLAGTLSMTMARDNFNHHGFGLVIAAAKAVTEQMRLRHLLQETQTIMEILGEAVIVLDANSRVRMINRYAKQLFHVQDDAIGRDFASLAETISGECFLRSGNKVKDNECSMRLVDGSFLQCVYSSSPVPEGGLCVTLRESRRVHKLTNRITRAKAVYTFQDIIGSSKSTRTALQLAHKASENAMTTLILGQSGVGKELFAQAIHNASDRRDQPFIVINCGAIPRDLVQSELFGYEGGAFTGASRHGAPGKFELADGGTLFLDEIGDMPLAAQVNLLRVLQEGEVTRVGGKRSRQVDVRVVAATHRDLARRVADGTFRHDLYYRLNVLVIPIPSLRERREDIQVLANFFLEKMTHTLNKPLEGFTPEAMHCLKAYDWPGNIRELENLVERAAVVADGPFIGKEDLPSEFWSPVATVAPGTDTPSVAQMAAPDTFDARDEADATGETAGEQREQPSQEKQRIMDALRAANGNVRAAAKDIGVSRVTLYAHIKRHGLSLEPFRQRKP
ncbi:sigma-54-dependent Fis family transcriptional regulator [Oceanidesulfovibrio marinus]|uniref:Transcriptional regulator n=1 Tax=Oceanidesulfovibrio marinus TaxID=370038 RepID=A0ABX6ND21_9BACT|nr:sigma 54-interacting transcriptional regulator [Oceanidesulfovibrio marinus]QJT08079.1 transcriptional regulator [Oceanidesulfovibrio marinus]